MKLQTGYIYHIKDEFFNIMDDKNLMMNHERGGEKGQRILQLKIKIYYGLYH